MVYMGPLIPYQKLLKLQAQLGRKHDQPQQNRCTATHGPKLKFCIQSSIAVSPGFWFI